MFQCKSRIITCSLTTLSGKVSMKLLRITVGKIKIHTSMNTLKYTFYQIVTDKNRFQGTYAKKRERKNNNSQCTKPHRFPLEKLQFEYISVTYDAHGEKWTAEWRGFRHLNTHLFVLRTFPILSQVFSACFSECGIVIFCLFVAVTHKLSSTNTMQQYICINALLVNARAYSFYYNYFRF